MKFFYNFLERISGTKNLEISGFKVSVLVDSMAWAVPPRCPSTACTWATASHLGQARAMVLPTLSASGSSDIECLSHAEDIVPSLCSSVAGP